MAMNAMTPKRSRHTRASTELLAVAGDFSVAGSADCKAAPAAAGRKRNWSSLGASVDVLVCVVVSS